MSPTEFLPWVMRNPNDAMCYVSHGLTSANIPTAQIPDISDKKAIQIAIFALSTLWICGVANKLGEISDLKDIWPGVFAWMKFLDSHCGSDGTYIEQLRSMSSRGEDLQSGSLKVVPLVISVLCGQASLRATIVASPGIVTMLTRRWVVGGLERDIQRQQDLSLALNRLLLGPERRNRGTVEEIVGATDGGAEVIACVALGHVRTFIGQIPVDYEAMTPHLGLIEAFSTSLVHPLRLAMLCQRSLPLLTEVLAIIDHNDSSPSPEQADCIAYAYSSIIEALRSANGAIWISQALDGGLLPAMLKSGARLLGLIPQTRDAVCHDLFKVLHQYLPYRSVLRSVARALRKVDRLNIGEESVGPLWAAWTEYKHAATMKLILKEDFDTRWSLLVTFGCGNKNVMSFPSFRIVQDLLYFFSAPLKQTRTR
jgi:hypothetical protein